METVPAMGQASRAIGRGRTRNLFITRRSTPYRRELWALPHYANKEGRSSPIEVARNYRLLNKLLEDFVQYAYENAVDINRVRHAVLCVFNILYATPGAHWPKPGMP